ncbi:hypothetical protein [Mycobacterium riyadhense]|uniref:hypothetical protein n=1 Tax=Mycobacterium riyadhense TaxID=486698 RepID=UPI00195DF0D0|nr:hypothetical protein [Mycobacterium riyadhense]
MYNDRIINGVSDTQAAARAAEAQQYFAQSAIANANRIARTAELEEKCRERISSTFLVEALINIINNKPPSSIYESPNFEKTDRQAGATVNRWFDSEAGSKVQWVSFLDHGDDAIDRMIQNTIGDDHGFDAGSHVHAGDLTAIRKGRAWKIAGKTTLEVVIEHVSQDAECDLRYLDGTAFGSCMNTHRKLLDSFARCDEATASKERRNYVAERFSTVPFVRGGVIVLTRICNQCLAAFSGNEVDIRKFRIVDPKPSGFGSVGARPITKSEYLWDKRVIAHVADDFEARNGRRPTTIELQKALQGAEFIGEGTPEARQFRKDHR